MVVGTWNHFGSVLFRIWCVLESQGWSIPPYHQPRIRRCASVPGLSQAAGEMTGCQAVALAAGLILLAIAPSNGTAPQRLRCPKGVTKYSATGSKTAYYHCKTTAKCYICLKVKLERLFLP